jgi:hypothetical protein
MIIRGFTMFFILIFLISCTFKSEEEIKVKVYNYSKSTIDSLKIIISDESDFHQKLVEGDSIIFILDYKNRSGENVFNLFYAQQDSLYISNFGYHKGSIGLKNLYKVFIFENGVGETENYIDNMAENKSEVKKWK